MMEAGMIPNVVDYYDVDTDPTGKFVPWEGHHLDSEGYKPGINVRSCLFRCVQLMQKNTPGQGLGWIEL